MRWDGFRKVRSQVCKRIGRRVRELDLEDLATYRGYLEQHEDEWARLDFLCRVTISRFYRDRGVFEALETEVLPVLFASARECGRDVVRAWSCGCASGEEAYTLAALWRARIGDRFPGTALEIVATDADSQMLERARRGKYTGGSIRELPDDLRLAAFAEAGEPYQIRENLHEQVIWRLQDVREEVPAGPFDLVFCRNLVLTYFDVALQREVMERVSAVLRPGGALVVGSHETLPDLGAGFERWGASLPIHRRVT
jgi:chemotaxis protein methyltransferase CheR